MRIASADYFRSLRIPLRFGRDISALDNGSSPAVVVLNEALARKFSPDLPLASVIGHRINSLGEKRSEPRWMTVIGIVGNIHDGGLSEPVEPEYYVPVAQVPSFLWPAVQRSLVLLVRNRNPDASTTVVTKALAEVVKSVDAGVPLADPRTMESFLKASLQTSQFNTLLLATLGAIALILAMVGVYGVVSWFVSQRTHEIGVRMALGATPAAIWKLIFYRGLTPIVLGMLVGGLLSFVTSGLLQQQLYGVSRGDVTTFGLVGLLLAAVSVFATLMPARRALRVSPVQALGAG